MDRYNNRLLLVARALEIIPGRGYLNFPSYKKKKNKTTTINIIVLVFGFLLEMLCNTSQGINR